MIKKDSCILLSLSMLMPLACAMENPDDGIYTLIDAKGIEIEVRIPKKTPSLAVPNDTTTESLCSMVKFPEMGQNIPPQKPVAIDDCTPLVPPHGKKALMRWVARHPEYKKESQNKA